jgi:hypothetical protein
VSRENNPNSSLVKHLEGGFEGVGPTLVAIQMGVEWAIHIFDSRLNDRRRTMGTWLEWPDKERVAFKWFFSRQDGVHLGMDSIEEFGIAICDTIMAILHPSRKAVEPHRSYGSVWSDNDSAHL